MVKGQLWGPCAPGSVASHHSAILKMPPKSQELVTSASFSSHIPWLMPSTFCLSPPGYEGVSEFFTDLLNHIATVLQGQSTGGAALEEVAPLRHNRLLAEQAGSLAGERTCSANPGCCGSLKGQDTTWKTETEAGNMGAGGSAKLPHQRLGCTTGVSPSFQQHCVASLATKASSQ